MLLRRKRAGISFLSFDEYQGFKESK